MRIVVFGAAGRTGQELVVRALLAGHRVTAFVHPEHSGSHDLDEDMTSHLHVVEGDVLDAEAVSQAVADHDAVLCLIGPVPGSPPNLAQRATTNLLSAMAAHGLRRIVAVTGALVGHPHEKLGLFYRFLESQIPHESLDDRRAQEAMLIASDLDWTLVRPPRLTDGPEHDHLEVGEDLQLHLLSHVSRADLAQFLLDELVEPAHHRMAVTLDT